MVRSAAKRMHIRLGVLNDCRLPPRNTSPTQLIRLNLPPIHNKRNANAVFVGSKAINMGGDKWSSGLACVVQAS